ncbi:myb protein [Salix suchowensis]|nr:myb protein [Salix suchowensis]
MEGVGARLGRSSTRYGPTTVFSGPVRKWKKRWVHVNPLSNHNSFHSHHHNATTNAAAAASSSATNHSSSSNGNNGSHLLLYKWTPLSQSNGSPSTTNHYNGNNINTTNENANLFNGDVTEEPPRRKFKYIPVDLIERQKKETEEQEEASEKIDDESKPSDTDPHAAEQFPRVTVLMKNLTSMMYLWKKVRMVIRWYGKI